MEDEEINEDWQSNLTNWKSLRKSQSSYQRVQDLETPEEVPQKPRAKTYKEMMEERQRRKSSHGQRSFDGIDDDDLDFGSSEDQGTSRDDTSNEDVVMSRSVQQSAANPGSFEVEELVGQSLRYTSEQTGGIREETKHMASAEVPPASNNNHFQKSNEQLSNDHPKTKADTDHDFSSALRDPKKSSNFSSHRDKFETNTTSTPTSAGKTAPGARTQMSGGANFTDKLKMWNKPTEPTQTTTTQNQKHNQDQQRASVVTGKENVIAKNSANMFFEKIIRINQRPNHEKGFGFTISGGREHNVPVVVDKVVRGGSADICELKAGDEIIAINGADVARHYNESVQNVLAQSVATGTIELKVKRLRDLEEEFDEEVFSDEESKPAPAQRKAHNFSGSQSSLWSSPPCSPPSMQSILDTSEFLTDDLPPPPLPSVPPPPPNWNTFPGENFLPPSESTSAATPVVSLGGPFPSSAAMNHETKSDHVNHRLSGLPEVPDNNREDILKKKSQFLGLKLEDTEEFKALKGDQEKKLKPERISKDESASSISVSNSWNSSVHSSAPNDLVPNRKSSFGFLAESNSTNASSLSSGFTMPGDVGRVQTEWSSSKRPEMDSKVNFAAEEEARKREQREQQKLKEREEQLKLMEEKIRQETEQLERERRRIAQDTEQQLLLEREKLRQENERQLQRERERLLKEKEEQLCLDQERLQREKEQMLRHQSEEQLKREKQRMERDMEEQLRLERERLMREKDDVIKREKERLQREQELQRERLQREQELQKDRLQHEKEEKLRQQNEEQLRRERQRLEKEAEEQLRLERERLLREKDEALRREKERLQREQELQKKELQHQFHLEQQRLEQMEKSRQLNSNATNDSLNSGISISFSSQPDNRKLSSEPSDVDVAEYSRKYGGKTFAQLAAQTRSDSKPPGKGEASFSRLGSLSEAGYSQELNRGPISKRVEKEDINENFSSIRSNFESSKAASVPSKDRALEPAPWRHGSQLNDRYPDERSGTGSAEYSQRPSLVPYHGRTVSLGSQVGMDRTATVEPQMRGPSEPNFGPIEPQLGPEIGKRTSSLAPYVGEQTTSYGQPTGGKALHEQHGAPIVRNQYASAEERRAPPLISERTASLGPQSREHNTPFGEQRTLYEGHADQTIRRPPEPNDQLTMTPLSNISYLLYGDEHAADQHNRAPENYRPDDIRHGGYNSHAQGYKPSGAPADNIRASTSNIVQRDKGFPSYPPPPSSALPAHQFNESSVPHNASTLPYLKKHDGAQAPQQPRPAGPKPFDTAWKYQSSVGDHWLIEEAERKRIAEQTGQERSWSLGPEHPHDLQKLPPDHGPDSSGVWQPVNPYANRPNAMDANSLRSPRSVPDPVKQTLLNRINVGTSLRSPTQLGPLPSYPKDYSQGLPSHSRSVSNPVTDSRLYGNVGPSAFPPPIGSMTTTPSHNSSGGAVDSLFAYHQQVAQPETNLTSLASLSHSQGSLHLDGTPQYSSVSQSHKIQGSYPESANAPQSYPTAGMVTNVQAQGGQPYRIYTTQEPGYTIGRDAGSFPSYSQSIVNNLQCSNCQRPLSEINGRVLMRDGDLKLQCQNCFAENEVKYSKV